MRAVDIIRAKRDGEALSREAIESFVRGVTDGSWEDYQASALLMAVVLKGMNAVETAWLTDAMARSGDRVTLDHIPGIKVGKHSTGGVGDKVSIVLAPLAASCGVVVPKMSGRGLGHTGGTLDKLESIPGFRVALSLDEFKKILGEVGCCLISQTDNIAPADKKLYALRDVTATVESLPLIAASVMSKKLAEGSTALVLDVKCGRGAFMQRPAEARALARAMVTIGSTSGVRTEAFITRMDTPLGRAVGNSVEIAECIDVLSGRGPADLTALIIKLASRMVLLGEQGGERRGRREQSARRARLRRRARKTAADDHMAGRRRRCRRRYRHGCRKRRARTISTRRKAASCNRSMRCSSGAPRWRSAPAATRRVMRSICPPASCCTRSRATRSAPASRSWNCATTTRRD